MVRVVWQLAGVLTRVFLDFVDTGGIPADERQNGWYGISGRTTAAPGDMPPRPEQIGTPVSGSGDGRCPLSRHGLLDSVTLSRDG